MALVSLDFKRWAGATSWLLFQVLYLQNFTERNGDIFITQRQPSHLRHIFESFHTYWTGHAKPGNYRLVLKYLRNLVLNYYDTKLNISKMTKHEIINICNKLN